MEEIVTLFVAEKQKGAGKRVKSSHSPSQTELEVLRAVYDCRFITAEQIIRYRDLSMKSLPMIQTKLKHLSGYDPKQPSLPYLQRFYQARFTPVGSLPFIYALLPAGKRALVASGLDMGILKRMPKIVKRLPAEINHHLVVNEVLIASLHLEKYEPRLHLSESVHDWKLKSRPFTVPLFQVHEQLQPAIHYSFVPDGYFEFCLNLGNRIAPRRLFWEIDLDTHERRHFKQKIAGYLAFFSSGIYSKQFGNVRNVSVVFATPKGDKRCKEMQRWVQEECEQPLFEPSMQLNLYGQPLSRRDCFDVFRFVTLHPTGGLDPRELFLQPCAFAVRENSPQPLIRLPQRLR